MANTEVSTAVCPAGTMVITATTGMTRPAGAPTRRPLSAEDQAAGRLQRGNPAVPVAVAGEGCPKHGGTAECANGGDCRDCPLRPPRREPRGI